VTLSPDAVVLVQLGPLPITATLAATWLVMALLTLAAFFGTRRLSTGSEMSRWQNLLETIVAGVADPVRDITQDDDDRTVPFIATLFLFIAVSNALTIVPGWMPPTSSLSTTCALALCVFVAVPFFGIARVGPAEYLRNYFRPTPLMLPFNVVGELSRTLALAVRLYGNAMSGTVIVALIVSIAPLFFPIAMRALGLLTGFVQAYIFAALAAVYIASGVAVQRSRGSQGTREP